jgi:Ca2+-binding EF-hand superfamily protein
MIATPLLAGNYKGGYKSTMSWNMQDMDTNQDGLLSLEEYGGGSQDEGMRKGFDMIDTNNDNVIDEEEWSNLLKAHGIKSN